LGALFTLPLASWVTGNVWPAILMFAERNGPVFAAMLNIAEPSPFPRAPDVTVIHGTSTLADHVHPLSAETLAATVPPAGLIARLPGRTSKMHGAASCTTWMRPSLTTISPVRVDGDGFAAARNDSWPLPCPDAGARSVIHPA
jgi:hypothetical protein